MIDPGTAPASAPRRHPRQNLILAVAAALLAAVVVIVLVVALRGSDGPSTGSPDAVTDRLVAALRTHDPAQVAAVSCRSARSEVAAAVRAVLAANTSAERAGSADVRGDNAVDRIVLVVDRRLAPPGPSGAQSAPSSAPVSATVALRRIDGEWCVDGFAAALPGH